MIMVNIERDILKEKKFFFQVKSRPVPKEHLFGLTATLYCRNDGSNTNEHKIYDAQ